MFHKHPIGPKPKLPNVQDGQLIIIRDGKDDKQNLQPLDWTVMQEKTEV